MNEKHDYLIQLPLSGSHNCERSFFYFQGLHSVNILHYGIIYPSPSRYTSGRVYTLSLWLSLPLLGREASHSTLEAGKLSSHVLILQAQTKTPKQQLKY